MCGARDVSLRSVADIEVGADVAPLGDVARVAEAVHKLRPRADDAVGLPAELGRACNCSLCRLGLLGSLSGRSECDLDAGLASPKGPDPTSPLSFHSFGVISPQSMSQSCVPMLVIQAKIVAAQERVFITASDTASDAFRLAISRSLVMSSPVTRCSSAATSSRRPFR